MDDKVLCTMEKPFEWRTIEDLNILSSINMNDLPSSQNDVLSPRLLVSEIIHLVTDCLDAVGNIFFENTYVSEKSERLKMKK